ncbi:MAG TPA: rod shape-determining protein RodA [Actinomycetota bacterium]
MTPMDMPLPSARASVREGSPLRHVDFVLLLTALGLAVFGVLMIYSATHRSLLLLGDSPSYYLKRQAVFIVLGAIAMAGTALFDYTLLKMWAPVIYLGSVGLLFLVRTPLGSSALGSQRWFQIAGFQFSPSLFSRLALILMLAAYLSEIKWESTLREVLRAVAIAALPMFLVFIQPDLGTTIILATILVTLLVVAGTRARYLVVLAAAATLAIYGAFQLNIIKQYQVDRLIGFMDQSKNSQTANYNLQQSKIAIGAGGLTGTGYLRGTQTNLDFVPEQHTDFIFTAVGEEFGFVGAGTLLVLFLILLWRTYRIAMTAKDPFGTYVAAGIAAMFTIQMFINIGMTIGIMPITGIPLPFMSYGGSGLIADFIGIGLLESIRIRRYA